MQTYQITNLIMEQFLLTVIQISSRPDLAIIERATKINTSVRMDLVQPHDKNPIYGPTNVATMFFYHVFLQLMEHITCRNGFLLKKKCDMVDLVNS